MSSAKSSSMSYSKISNRDVRNGSTLKKVDNEKEEEDIQLVKYPNNFNFRDMLYFKLAPTLGYELNFPRTDRIRKRFLAKRLLEVIVLVQLIMMSLVQQWIIPSVKNSLIPFSHMEVAKASERLLKLSILNHLIFHLSLNVTGKLLHFPDRNFIAISGMPIILIFSGDRGICLDTVGASGICIFRWLKWATARHLRVHWCSLLVFSSMNTIGPLHNFKIWAFLGMIDAYFGEALLE